MDTNLLLAGRTSFADPVPADGDVSALSLNKQGRLRVASKPDTYASATGDLDLLNEALTVFVDDAANLVLHVKNTGSVAMAAGAFIFEGSNDSSDGTDGTWFGLLARRSNANTVEGSTGTLALGVGAGIAYAWAVSVNGVRWFRVRCTTAVTALSMASWTVVRAAYATDPVPAVQAHAITGTVTTTGTVTGTVATTTALVSAGGSSYNLTTAASTNAAIVKSTAGTLAELTITNPTATAFYVKLYNKATAPVPGTDTPLLTIPVPANSFINPNFGAVGKRFSAGIGIAVTAAIATTDVAVAVAGGLISATYV